MSPHNLRQYHKTPVLLLFTHARLSGTEPCSGTAAGASTCQTLCSLLITIGLQHNGCVPVRPSIHVCVSLYAHVYTFKLWLSDFWDYRIRPQMSRTDPKSNTQRQYITLNTHIHTYKILSRTSSVSGILHGDSPPVVFPFIATHPGYTQIRPMIVLQYYKTRQTNNPTLKAALLYENINLPVVTSDDPQPFVLGHEPALPLQ